MADCACTCISILSNPTCQVDLPLSLWFRLMDTGCFYRGESSITSSLSGSQRSPVFSNSTDNLYDGTCSSYSSPAHAPSLAPYSTGFVMNQKLDHLLHLFSEQKTQNSELQKEVLALKNQVIEIKKQQDLVKEVKNDGSGSQRKSLKLPPEISVSNFV